MILSELFKAMVFSGLEMADLFSSLKKFETVMLPHIPIGTFDRNSLNRYIQNHNALG
jgi:hypothetical protein